MPNGHYVDNACRRRNDKIINKNINVIDFNVANHQGHGKLFENNFPNINLLIRTVVDNNFVIVKLLTFCTNGLRLFYDRD